jgi:hypothetical protein
MKITEPRKQELKALPVTSAQRRAVAVHESGHAVTTCSLGLGLHKRGIVLRGREGTTYGRGTELHSRNPQVRKRSYRALITIDFAGPIAEYRVDNWAHIDDDLQNIALRLRKLLPRKNDFVENAWNIGDSWGNFWAMICCMVTHNEKDRALAALDESVGLSTIDMSIFELLWPLAQQAQSIVQAHWSTIEEIADELVRKGRLSGREIEGIISRHSIVASA